MYGMTVSWNVINLSSVVTIYIKTLFTSVTLEHLLFTTVNKDHISLESLLQQAFLQKKINSFNDLCYMY